MKNKLEGFQMIKKHKVNHEHVFIAITGIKKKTLIYYITSRSSDS
mgnify:CR=1 FL=1